MYKRWTLHYTWLKVVHAVEAASATVAELRRTGSLKSSSDMTEESMRRVREQMRTVIERAFLDPMTEIIKFTGPAMSPTLNRKGADSKTEAETLVMRRLWLPQESVRIGDVVCFQNPLNTASHLMVRRVGALAGDVLADGVTEHVLGPGVCWVLADNPKLKPPDVEDSRTFGPLPLENIEGRVIYAARSKVDHGPVTNHSAWKSADAAVLGVESHDDLFPEDRSADVEKEPQQKSSENGQ